MAAMAYSPLLLTGWFGSPEPQWACLRNETLLGFFNRIKELC